MPVRLSPGMYATGRDLSLYVPALSTTIFAVVGGARKGPLDTPTQVGSLNEFIDKFGYPCTQGGWAMMTYLRQGKQGIFIRVAASSVAANVTIWDSGAVLNTLKLEGNSTGEWGNDLKATVVAGTASGTCNISILYQGLNVEIYNGLTKANMASTINAATRYVVATDIASSTSIPAFDTYTLANGANGTTGLADADYIGTITGDTATGMQTLGDPDTIDLNILAVPGVSSAAVVNAGLSLAASRKDTIFLVDPPQGLSTQDVQDWHNGAGAYSDHQAFNSSYGALQWAWHQIYDPYSKQAVWIAPSGPTAALYAFTDYNYELWYAPAGYIRGHVLDTIAIEYSPRQGQRDFLQGNGNAINPYVKFSKDGICLFGQRTLQRAPTALDRVCTRRMLMYAEKVLATAAKYLLFEPNDSTTWDRLRLLADSALAPIKSRRGLYDYRIICDSSTNTPDVIDQNKVICKVVLKPMKTAEAIELEWTLVSTGSTFTEVA